MDFRNIDIMNSVATHPLYTTAAVAALVAAVGLVRDHWHSRRRDLDNVSLVSWGAVSNVAIMVTIVCLAMGFRNGG